MMEGAPGATLLPAPKTDTGGGGAGAVCGEERSGLAATRAAPEDPLVASEAGRRARAAASRSRSIEAARTLASPGNAAAGPGGPRPNSRGLQAGGAPRPPSRAPTAPRWRQSLAATAGPRTFPPARPPGRRSARPFSARPWRRPSAPPDYLLWLFPQRRRLRGGHLELPDSSAAVAAAPRTAEARGGGGRGNGAVAHVPTASGPVELGVARKIRIYKRIRGRSALAS